MQQIYASHRGLKTHLPASKQHHIAAALIKAKPRRETFHWPQSTLHIIECTAGHDL